MNALKLHHKRQTLYAILLTLAVIAVPFVTYEGVHLLLFDFYHHRFEFLFSVTEVGTARLIALFVLIAAGMIMLLNLTLSRYFCGNLCPKTLLSRLYHDSIETRLLGLGTPYNRQSDKERFRHPLKQLAAYLLLLLITIVSSWAFFLYLIPWKDWISLTYNAYAGYEFLGVAWGGIGLYLFAEALFFKNFFCSYLCPYQMTALAFANRARHTFHESPECQACEACVRICPIESLDIRQGFESRCIECGDCAAVCETRLGESLIDYMTPQGRKPGPFASALPPLVTFMTVITVTVLLLWGIFELRSERYLDACYFDNAELHVK